MKIHTPIFILGLLVFVTPVIGLPQIYEQVILGAFGIAIMLLISSTRLFEDGLFKKDSASENRENKMDDLNSGMPHEGQESI